MKNRVISVVVVLFMFSMSSNAQKINDKIIGSVGKVVKGFSFSNEEAVALAKAAVDQMDKENPVADSKDKYTVRLKKIFSKHTTENGIKLNYKVYKVKEVNAFACADGSVRVYQGLMDVMDDNEVLAVIGHEIGHVVNNDSQDAVKAAYKKEALIDAVSSQSDKIAALTSSDLGKIGNLIIDSKHSRMQESEADLYSYDFMKRNGYNVNAVESAFTILAKLSEGADASFLSRITSSHPDAKERAENAKMRAEKDGLYKPYVKKSEASKTKTVVKKKKK
ncbi:M48 family metalloprotease [Flavobacterium polysaccharolyticum]|uniref:M48 family metalloprotease n=1 Tax=Flavobacterium polysaccharolyticum TaxID=3133148 RepID=UPI003CCBD092